MKLSKRQLDYLGRARVARLGTIDSKGRAHIVPIVFANSTSAIFLVIDRKRKTQSNLKRLRNLAGNNNATFLVDNYSEDWRELSFLMIYCEAEILPAFKHVRAKRQATKLFQKKYAQYRNGQYFPSEIEKAVFVKLRPTKAVFWQNSRHSLP